jgi:RNA polymerase sigma-70 factor (ECF subfamily)
MAIDSIADVATLETNELVRRAVGGCADAFTVLAQRFRPRLLHLLQRRFGGCHADAEDLTQEALTRAFQRLGQFDERYSFSTWLYTLTMRLAHDQHRRRKTRDRHFSIVVTDCSGLPAPAIARDCERDNLWEVAQRCLTEPQYMALWLRFGEDLSVAEVAQVMARSPVGVRVLLHRARTTIIRYLPKDERHDRNH